MKILFVEDDAGVGMVISRLLSEVRKSFPEAEVVWETNLKGAMTHLHDKPYPAVVLSDLLLPDSSLANTVSVMRAVHQLAPVVFITGQPIADVEKALGPDIGKITVVEKGGENWLGRVMGALSSTMQKRAVETSKDEFKGLYATIAALQEKGYGIPKDPSQ